MNVTFDDCTKRFGGGVTAVRDFSLRIDSGELFVLLGPSGCGKSTLLNLAAGLEQPTSGRILFGERVVADPARRRFEPPRNRDVAMVFQSYALYPHMTVFDNVAFPLRIARRKRPEIEQAVRRTAAMLGIDELMERRPGELSGGQRQRVAIARAVVRHPAVFLLDEPLSNLDAQLRTSTRAELKALQRRLGVTTIYVTHDQVEAMTLGDRIALLRDGTLVQVGTPQELYEQPATPFAATFVGSPPMNLLEAELLEAGEPAAVRIAGRRLELPGARRVGLDDARSERVLLGVRPERVELRAADAAGAALPGRVATVEALGREMLCHLDVDGRRVLAVTTASFEQGQTVEIRFAPEAAHLFAPGPERR